MTHGDGGKGSARRKEDVKKIHDNWDRIFGAKAPESSPTAAGTTQKDEPMNDYDEEDDPQERSDEDYERSEDEGEWTCDRCGGLMHRMPLQGYARCDDCGARQELINDDYT